MTVQSVEYAMRSLTQAILLGLAATLASATIGQARVLLHGAATGNRPHRSSPALFSLQVSAGYQDEYRDTAWTPVRVTLRNGTNADVTGAVQLSGSDQSSSGASASFHGIYQMPVTLPAGGTKHVTLYMPGSTVQDQTNVAFRQGNRILASGSAYPMGVDTSALMVGAMTDDPATTSWLVQATQQQVTTHVIRMTPTTLDAIPQALATFDLIVLSNSNSSRLDAAQLTALERYVQDGGSLLLVGGPTWQESLRPLSSALLPGRLVGTRTLPNLHGLASLGSISTANGAQATSVSVLSGVTGTVWATQAGVPLVVRKQVGSGDIEYLAFDPALSPVQQWHGGYGLLGHLISMAAPLATSRTWSPQGFRARFQSAFSSMAISGELSNVPAAAVPLLVILAILIISYILLVGPVNFLVLRSLRRQHLVWVTIPVLSLLCIGSTLGVTARLRGSTILLNSIGMVTLDGGSGPHPATFYVGLSAPLGGDYDLAYDAPAMPAPIAESSGLPWQGTTASTASSPALGVQEGAQTEITVPAMKKWSVQNMSLETSVNIPGQVRSDLRVNSHGNIAGTIHNGTHLTLIDPVIVAGQAVARLSNIPVGATIRAAIQPNNDLSNVDQSSVWSRLYGGSTIGGENGFGWGPRWCCDQLSFPPEKNLTDRVRNAAAMLLQTQSPSALADVILLGWNEQPLGTFTVNGSVPQQRVLNLIVVPLSVQLPSAGSFVLRGGTLGAHLVDVVPRVPDLSCCNWFSRDNQQITVGAGGSLTFEFDLPDAPRAHFRELTLDVNNGANGTNVGSIYNWRSRKWVSVNLASGGMQVRNPNRYISPGGQFMLRLQATTESGDVSIDDPEQDLELLGTGIVT